MLCLLSLPVALSRPRTRHQPPPSPARHAIARPDVGPTPGARNRTARSASEGAYHKPQGAAHAPALRRRGGPGPGALAV